MIELEENNQKRIYVEEFDEFDWFQLMKSDSDFPKCEDDKELMRIE